MGLPRAAKSTPLKRQRDFTDSELSEELSEAESESEGWEGSTKVESEVDELDEVDVSVSEEDEMVVKKKKKGKNAVPKKDKMVKTPTKVVKKARKSSTKEEEDPDTSPSTLTTTTPSEKKPKIKWSKTILEFGSEWKDGDVDQFGLPIKKPRKKRVLKSKDPVVYEIPEVEKLETSYKGRLGYACLNTILRNQKPPIFCARTCRIDTILNEEKGGREHLLMIGKQNMIDLKELIIWNAKHDIYFMRMSSEMFPFASHAIHGYSLEYASAELKAAGDEANRLGVRLTTHPGQFTQLGSPTKKVVENAKRDLAYHCEMMERMGLGKDSVMIIHGGGVYGDKAAAIARFKTEYLSLPQNIQDRLVLENDEICFNVDDLLPLCEELNIPLVLDYHHDWIYPSEKPVGEMMERILETWKRKGIKAKQHLSEPRKGAETIMERRAHADRCQRLPKDLPDDMDLMIEAKDKEQAVFHLFRIYNLHPTIQEDLRPPALEETKQTAGRKGNKRASAQKKKLAELAAEEEAKAAEDGEAVESGDEGLMDEED